MEHDAAVAGYVAGKEDVRVDEIPGVNQPAEKAGDLHAPSSFIGGIHVLIAFGVIELFGPGVNKGKTFRFLAVIDFRTGNFCGGA